MRSRIAFINVIANWSAESVGAILNETWRIANTCRRPNMWIVSLIVDESAFLGNRIAGRTLNLKALVSITAKASLTGTCEAANCIVTISVDVAVVDLQRTFINIQTRIRRSIQLVARRTAARKAEKFVLTISRDVSLDRTTVVCFRLAFIDIHAAFCLIERICEHQILIVYTDAF